MKSISSIVTNICVFLVRIMCDMCRCTFHVKRIEFDTERVFTGSEMKIMPGFCLLQSPNKIEFNRNESDFAAVSQGFGLALPDK